MSWKENTRVCTRCHAWRQKVDGDSAANGHLSAEVETREPSGGGGTDGGSDVKQEEKKKSELRLKLRREVRRWRAWCVEADGGVKGRRGRGQESSIMDGSGVKEGRGLLTE